MYASYCRPGVKMNSETNKGKSCFAYKGNKFRAFYRKKNGKVCFDVLWRLVGRRVLKRTTSLNMETMITLTTLAMLQLLRYEFLANTVLWKTYLSDRPRSFGLQHSRHYSPLSLHQMTSMSRDVVKGRAATYRVRRKQYSTLPKSPFETIHILREIAISTHKKEDFLMFKQSVERWRYWQHRVICAFCVYATFCWWTEHSHLVLATLRQLYTLFTDMLTTLMCRWCTLSSQTRISWRKSSFLVVL